MKNKIILILLLLLSGFVNSHVIQNTVYDYETMNTLNETTINAYNITTLINSCITNNSGECNFNLTDNLTYNFILNKSSYTILNEEKTINDDENYSFILQNLDSSAILTLYMENFNAGLTLCIANMSNCYQSNETITLNERIDTTIILIPETVNIRSPTYIIDVFDNIINTFGLIAIILIIIMGVYHAFKLLFKRS